MRKLIISLFLLLFFLSFSAKTSYAIVNPLSVSNNKFGVHILFPSELGEAASLVNSGGGDWGYVTIPIQSGDKNMAKWQKFMDEARRYHLIPIIRLSTEGDYFNTKVWRTPTRFDIIDFANFLNSLTWPTKNRYVVIFNEPNRADEWGGSVDPAGYAKILSYAYSVFKSRSKDFFIISAGLDNAAGNGSDSMNEYDFLRAMQTAIPGVFNQIDGIASHSYPNPGFEQSPRATGGEGTASFKSEKSLIEEYSEKDLPVFITETGWLSGRVSGQLIRSYYDYAFNSVWNEKDVVAVTPFLLSAEAGPFKEFSLLTNGKKSSAYLAIEGLPKTKGQPVLAPLVLSDRSAPLKLAVRDFNSKKPFSLPRIEVPFYVKMALKWLLKL
ncbi:hypothetical protein M1615_00280 [Patescibacteria group bacterium]|nr:hypothetical protein [Patescibacteria group bacterium]